MALAFPVARVMSQTTARTAIAALTLTAIALLSGVAHADSHDTRVVVRVYDAVPVTPAMREAAIRTAAAIVEEAGIAVDWYDCTEQSLQPSCQDSRRTLNFIVRLMPTFVPAARGSRIALETRKSARSQQSELGFAIIDPHTLVGAMATIYHDRVEAAALGAGVERSELLGRALAHEVGHLLLQSRGHSPSGLMRAVWTDEELIRNRADDWAFAASDRDRVHHLLAHADRIELRR